MLREVEKVKFSQALKTEEKFYPYYTRRLRRKLIAVNIKKAVKFYFLGKTFQRRYFTESLGMFSRQERRRWSQERPLLVHACSIGEVLAAQPLLEALRETISRSIVVTTKNFTAYDKAVSFGTSEAVYYLPYDDPWVIRRVLEWLRPAGVILLEADWWPNWMKAWHLAGVPVTVASGRFMPTQQVYGFQFSYTPQVLGFVRAFGMQSRDQADAVQALAPEHPRVSVTGNLKFAKKLSGPDKGHQAQISRRLGLGSGSRVFMAGSVFDREADSLSEAAVSLLKIDEDKNELLVVIAPRYPEWAGTFRSCLSRRGVQSVYWTTIAHRPRRDEERVVIVDTVGELEALYGVADVAFVGNSLYPDGGGQNILEPINNGVPTLTGPYYENFKGIVDEFLRRKGALCVDGPESLASTTLELLRHPARAQSTVEAARDVLKDHKQVVEKTLAFLLPQLEQV